MGIDDPTFDKKMTNFYQFKSRSVSKVVFFLIFEPILRAGFLTKCWLFQARHPPLSLFLAYWLLYFHNFVLILFERLLFN